MNPICPRCGAQCSAKFGHYFRKDDAQLIQRYRCMACLKCHSSATRTPTYQQKKRRLNRLIEMDIASSTSQRRIAIKHKCSRKTVGRKVAFLAERARIKTQTWLIQQSLFDHVQWDELISFEHTRLKPLSIAVMSSVQHRCIIGYGVAQIPASGVIAQRSREKYGRRVNRSGSMRKRVLAEVAKQLSSCVFIESDEHPRYAKEIKQALPSANHVQHRSVRGSLTGQGELKRTGYDPLFAINHTLAMMRDNIKRFARKTWCTTKRVDALNDVLAIYIHYHNTVLIPEISDNGCTA